MWFNVGHLQACANYLPILYGYTDNMQKSNALQFSW